MKSKTLRRLDMDLVWQILTAVVIIVITAVVILKLYSESIKGKCTSTADLTGKVAIVTGANIGIGYYTALDFARRNARVILACRSLQKGREAVDNIRSATGNKDVVVMKLDLGLFASVREFAAHISQRESRLDILVNNAGVFLADQPTRMTEDGMDMMMAVNYFGHFLLTNLLLDLLKKSAPSRIVNVSSAAHGYAAVIDFDNLKAEKSYDVTLFYRTAKLCNILFTRELAKRLEETGVTCYSLHPGVVRTEIWRDLSGIKGLFISAVYLFFKTSEEGAETTVYCSVSEELEGTSGKYYLDCREAEEQSSDQSKDMGLAKKLWEISEKYTGLEMQE